MGEIAPEVRHIPEELLDFAHSDNIAGLAVLSYFASHSRYPSIDEFELTMQALYIKTVKYQANVPNPVAA
jgi:hypothetical protein